MNTNSKKKKQHGGRRKNSGRKESGRKPYLVRMKPATMDNLKRDAAGKTFGEYLDDLFVPPSGLFVSKRNPKIMLAIPNAGYRVKP